MRALLVVGILLAVLFAWIAVRWQLGSMLANLTPPSGSGTMSLAQVAHRWAPSDPVTSWLLASAEADAGERAAAVRRLEEAVRLSPGDYRWRIELGRAYEQNEMLDKAETELKRAIELAPSYAFPRWQLGNFYLRQGRENDAFRELRSAAANSHTYREQVFSLAWDYFDKDADRVEQLAPETPDGRASLALFFAARGRASAALRVWDKLRQEEKQEHRPTAELIAMGLYSQRSFPEALEFFRQLGLHTDAQIGVVTNPGFELALTTAENSPFGWQLPRTDPKLDIAADSGTRHGGNRSLRVAFRNYSRPDLANTFQIVAVEPGRRYRLTFWLLTENLKTSGPPLLAVMNANNDKLLASSKPFPTGSSQWSLMMVEFQAPENCNGIRLQTTRVPCGEQCPIVGTFWYDDFELAPE